jgi:hypothetical protein
MISVSLRAFSELDGALLQFSPHNQIARPRYKLGLGAARFLFPPKSQQLMADRLGEFFPLGGPARRAKFIVL